ncbi:hypothetical protein FD25_GL002005 [Levilactobacillus acidifarinae DSM 19394]|uniref:Uncharacterized protein n=2 Tax=Levilactobacillus acidifarinae TaxID=267364 RepID=A0A0R1LKM9_9LACO|nr:hypothetical protein FD25_GL002005 [Levilactobacillus acidifarinae DSM 19394]
MHSERFAFIRVIENFLFLMFAILFLLTGSYGVFHDFNKTALRNGNFIQDLALLLAGVFFSIATIQVWKYGKAKITFIKMEAIKSQGSKDFNNFILYHKIDDSIYMVLNVDDALSGKFKNFLVITADSLKNYKFEVLSRSELESYQKNSVKSTDKE